MDRRSWFSYQCNQCGRCCHNQVITLSPYDVIRIARAARISTGEAVAKYTVRRGSVLKFTQDGSCAALHNTSCALHSGRPLACRLYPLGLEHDEHGLERFLRLEPAAGSHGVYGEDGGVQDFLAIQEAEPYLDINDRYARLLEVFRRRIADLSDFDFIEPREFWRAAIREALAETDFDPNPIIEALFDPDSIGCSGSELEFVECHLKATEQQIRAEQEPAILAAAGVLLAVSLGYSPAEVIMR
jgi:uncharacterized protein